MGLKAFLLVNVADDMQQNDLNKAVKEIEETPGVDFVDPVIGSKDLVIMVNAPITVEAIANKIRNNPWITNVEVLRIVSLHERLRSSKSELLKTFKQTGT
jgi:hypothetical protein